jgi:hypothetical protein
MDNVLTVEQIFGERLLVVPDYQRGYSWEARQLTDFTDDLELLAHDKEHYTGTLILHPQASQREMDAEGKSYLVTHVVDGQQRLTTIVLLLNVIRREFEKLSLSTLAEGVRKTYISTDGLSGHPMLKLRLNRDVNDFWASRIVSEQPGIEGPRIQSHRRLQAAANYFAEYLSGRKEELASDRYREWMLDLFNKVTHQLKMTLYNVSEAADVGVIFEVMNDRGKPLTELEKVKNFLLYSATKIEHGGTQLAEAINGAWRDILENLMKVGLTDFEDQLLRAHWLMSYEPQARLWNQSKSVKERFSLRAHAENLEQLHDELLEYTRSLQQTSLAFCEVMNPRHPEAFGDQTEGADRAKLEDSFEKLRRTRQVASFLPLLLATRLRFQGEPRVLLDMCKLCERFAFRVYLLIRSPSHSGQTALFRLGHLLFRGQISEVDALRELQALCLRFSPTPRFEEQFRLDETTNWYTWAGIKYFLYEYEEALTGPREQRLSWDHVDQRDRAKSIEHILPQSPDAPYWQDRFTLEQIELYTHDIGNLCLTYAKDNSVYSNKTFPEKKGAIGSVTADRATPQPCYSNSVLMQEHRLAAINDWTPKAIEGRRREIIDWAKQRWAVAEIESQVDLISEEDDEQGTDEMGDPTGSAQGSDYEHAAITPEEAHITACLPSRANPWVIQPYNSGLHSHGSKGASGKCLYCDTEAGWSAKGANRWFALCSRHMSGWTGWENRAGAELVSVDEEQLKIRSAHVDPGKSGRDSAADWTWERYLAESGHSRSKVDLVRLVTDRIRRAIDCEDLKYKQQIHFFPIGLPKTRENRIARLQFWNAAPRLVADGLVVDPVHDPFPQLPGKRLAHSRTWYWDFPRPEDVPLDLSPIVRLVEASR